MDRIARQGDAYRPVDLPALTSLRFFAALWVVLFHLRSRIDLPDGTFLDMMENGARGVDFFFVLSGFVIYHVSRRAMARDDFDFNRFMWRRFSRIYPLHLAVLLGFIAISVVPAAIRGAPVEGLSLADLASSLFLVQAWNATGAPGLNAPAWTLSAEMFAYALFGLTALAIGRHISMRLLLISGLIAFGVVHLAAGALGEASFVHLTYDFGILRIVPTFILGMALCQVAPLLPRGSFVWIALAGAAWWLVVASFPGATYAFLPAFALIVLGCSGLPSHRLNPLSWRPLVYLGELSYGVYLTHILVFTLWFHMAPQLIPGLAEMGIATQVALVLAAVLATSAIGFHVIERPARARLNALMGPRRNPGPAMTD